MRACGYLRTRGAAAGGTLENRWLREPFNLAGEPFAKASNSFAILPAIQRNARRSAGPDLFTASRLEYGQNKPAITCIPL